MERVKEMLYGYIQKKKSSSYELYQFFVNVEDVMVIDYLKKSTHSYQEKKLKNWTEKIKRTSRIKRSTQSFSKRDNHFLTWKRRI